MLVIYSKTGDNQPPRQGGGGGLHNDRGAQVRPINQTLASDWIRVTADFTQWHVKRKHIYLAYLPSVVKADLTYNWHRTQPLNQP